jgi:hypothetical protein
MGYKVHLRVESHYILYEHMKNNFQQKLKETIGKTNKIFMLNLC